MKRVWKILITLSISIVVLLVILALSINAIARTAVEKAGTAALGTEVTAQKASVGLMSGSAEIKGLVIANPKEFEGGNLFELHLASVSVSVTSLLSDTIEVPSIVIDSPTLRLRQQGLTSNLKIVLDNTRGEAPSAEAEPRGEAPSAEAEPRGEAPSAEAEPGGEAPSAAKKFKIGRIQITRAQLEYALGGAPPVRVTLPDIDITDVSNADGTPLLLGDVFVKVLYAMAKSAAASGAGLIPDDVKDTLSGIRGVGTQAVEKTLEGAGNAVRGVGSLVNRLTGKKEE